MSSYLRELESMAKAAREKGRPSADLLEGVANTWRAHDGDDVPEAERREAFDYAIGCARHLDGEVCR
ncbi:MAG: hypothetical protein K8H88_29055 [Sandaracinaceae bacterium]|nr:hypothetical protein [Sandaracinaceae bacterium]